MAPATTESSAYWHALSLHGALPICLTRRAALWRHAVRNALIPVVTIMGLQFSFLLAGTIIIETVFYLTGLGRLVFQALEQRALVVVKDLVMLLAAAEVVVNLIVDLLFAVLDPPLPPGGPPG